MNLIGLSVALVLVGWSLGLAVGRRVPLAVLTGSAYLLGAAAWAAVTAVILVLGIPYTLVSAGTGTAAVGLASRPIASRHFTSGRSKTTRRSKRPGRSKAGSKISGRLVAAIMMILVSVSKPSISTSIWFKVCSRSS